MTLIIGLTGKARHGKGSVVQLAQILRQSGDEELEIKQVSFATALKTIARTTVQMLQGVGSKGVDHESAAVYYLMKLGLPERIAQEVVSLAQRLEVEDLTKKTPGGRKLLQYIGTEAFRVHVDDLYWVKEVARKIALLPKETQIVFIPDCRFINEADYIRKIGGLLWRVERVTPATSTYLDGNHVVVKGELIPFDNGLTPEQKAHPSETQLDGYPTDATLVAADIDQLFHAVRKQIEQLQKDGKL